MYENTLPFAQAEIAYRTEQIAISRGRRHRLSRHGRVRRGAASSDAVR